MSRISFIFGTRPEAIKLCPLILKMREQAVFDPHVCVTGQHREMLDQVLEVFGVKPDVDLALMRANQSLASLTARTIAACDEYLATAKPDMVLVQGDTTTVFCAAMAAFYRRIPIGHVEAGLRTWNRFSPFPEEINRTLTTRLADLHFAPTKEAQRNLLREDVPAERIVVTGNTVIDALFFAVDQVKSRPPEIPGLPHHLLNGHSDAPLVLITGHRRENFGEGFENICRAIAELAHRFPEIHFVYPVHLNPNVRGPVYRLIGKTTADTEKDKEWNSPLRDPGALHGSTSSCLANVHLIEPLGYLPFVALMDRATLVLTDSGGVQEEAPSLGKPVLVMRDTTERPEAVEMGTVRLVGTDCKKIVCEVSRLLDDATAYAAMARSVNPYGDGHACGRILAACEMFFRRQEHGAGQSPFARQIA
ncbi:MAG: UDP-N-acetylglucosamine 2-epimerase (non-hydrolyzing) [Rhodopirellula sp.]|nr:UDP-N-acetylglucosamine 2-epimerase (non-hydrolyzing) [Rhodopirellula sp.]